MTSAKGESQFAIRPAIARDYERIVEVWVASGLPVKLQGRESREAFVRQLQSLPGLYLVAMDGERIVGVILGSHDHRKGWINRLAVLPEYRRRGIAADLVLACERALQAEGMEITAALIEEDNATSRLLFEKLGYRADVPAAYYRKLTRPDA